MSKGPITSLSLDHGKIRHGFFTRRGGCSSGLYHSLNCGPGNDDHPENVQKNRQTILAMLDPHAEKICGLYQIHSNVVHFLDQPWEGGKLLKGDGMVTRQKNIVLGILTADCAPVLLADPENGVIGAAHAGWQGALTGIVENTVQMMCDNGAENSNIVAAIGPCIAQQNYEVGPEFLKNFTDLESDHQRFFTNSPKENHHLFDLRGFVLDRLEKAGIQNISVNPHDTYALEDDFFSYRRSTHRGEVDYGRQISAIMLV